MKWLLGIAITLLLSYFAFQLAYPTYTHRYRLTIGIEVDGKESIGSSVVEVNARDQPKVLPHLGLIVRIRGEAVQVDLGRHGTLFAILAHGPHGKDPDLMRELALQAFALPKRAGFENYGTIRGLRGSRDLALSLIPTLVLLADISDVDSARVVRPDRLEQDIGPRVHLRRAQVELTDDFTATQLAQKLSWLNMLKNDRKRLLSFPNAYQPSYLQFIRE